jgi:hypothetical protein
MSLVSTAFKLIFYSVVLGCLAVLAAIVAIVIGGGALAAGGGLRAGLGAAGLLMIGANVLSVVAAILGLLGLLLCLAVPSDTGNAKVLIMISIGALVGAVALPMAAAAGAAIAPAAGVMAVYGLSMLLSIVSGIVFLLFCKALAEYLGRPDLADLAMTILWLMVIIFVLEVGMVIAVFAGAAAGLAGAGAAGGVFGMVVGCAIYLLVFVLGIMALIKFAQLTRDMSEACGRFADRGSGGDDPVW